MKHIGFIFMLLFPAGIAAQHILISGKVTDTEGTPLPGASIYWAGTTMGTSAENDGSFEIEAHDTTHLKLVASYVGFRPDTLILPAGYNPGKESAMFNFRLRDSKELSTIVIEGERSASYVSFTKVNLVEIITQRELKKAACCNLSESFETNASVDVSFSDGVTGAKHITMLGLDGRYVQTTTELLPGIRGLAAPFGLTYIPGTYIESIQVSKGAGSVVNGYEAVTGQINIELKKPENSERLHLNAYVNHMGRVEGNLVFTHRFRNQKWFTATLGHFDYFNTITDQNNDSFLDMPLVKQGNFVHRWRYEGKRIETQFGIKGLYELRNGGNTFYYNHDSLYPRYGMQMETFRGEAFWKFGILFPGQDWKSIGIQTSGLYHQQQGFFGLNAYKGVQKNAWANIIYQSIFSNTKHKFRTGASFLYDQYDEAFADTSLARMELVPGGFFEYSYENLKNLTLVIGGRLDYHNLYGFFPVPRINLRWEVVKGLNWRISGGRGWRVPNLFAENTAMLVSSRNIIIQDRILPEVAWNYGTSLQYTFQIRKREASIVADFFRTDFTNQLMVDRETSGTLRFYNLTGASFSNVFQFSFSFEPVKKFNIRMSYKYQDVRSVYGSVLERVPLVPEHKALLNLSYTTPKLGFTFDFTTNLSGPSRYPAISDPQHGPQPAQTPWYALLNAQITKDFKILEWYVGCENITGYKQALPVIDAQNPFGNNFDASLVWAPIFGRMFYTGIRFQLDYKTK